MKIKEFEQRYAIARKLVKQSEDVAYYAALKLGLTGVGISGKVHKNGNVSVTLYTPNVKKKSVGLK